MTVQSARAAAKHLFLSSKKEVQEARAVRPSAQILMATSSSIDTLLDLRQQFLGFIERRVRDRAAAEDVLQSAYVHALAGSGKLRDEESAVAWFYRILRNAIIDRYRRSAREDSALSRLAREIAEKEAAEPELYEATCACIAGALQVLTPGYAELLREVDLGEQSLSEYAAAHAITTANAAVRAHRARAALRRQLIRCCGVCSTHGCLECTCAVKSADATVR